MDLTTIIIIIGGVLAGLMVIAGLITMRGERQVVDERLEQIFEEEDLYKDEKKTPLTDWINNRMEGSKAGTGISRKLAQADLKLKPGEYVALMVIASFGMGVVGWFYGGRNIIFGILGAVVGLFLPRMYVNRQKKGRLAKFGDQLPDMLNLVVNSLRAGYSNMQALEAVGKELPPPISDEFRRVVREMQLGISMEEAFENLLRRIPSADLDLVVTAMNIQREVGGNLAEILDIIAYTIRERIRMKREIQTLVSQVMYSGRTLALMPLILSLILWGANRAYMMNFFIPENRSCGIPILCVGLGMVGTGYFVMTKIADIEV